MSWHSVISDLACCLPRIRFLAPIDLVLLQWCDPQRSCMYMMLDEGFVLLLSVLLQTLALLLRVVTLELTYLLEEEPR